MVAAVDLGSNSFHMVVARLSGTRLQLVDRIKERVALAEGLGPDKRISKEAKERAIACLERFGQRLAEFPPGTVRAVGTNTLRKAKDGKTFLRAAQRALGHEIGIISGREEARLVYLGVAHSLADDEGRRLVIDIGGGSTEVVIGARFETQLVDSLYMGCVSFSQRFFPKGVITARAMAQAVMASRVEAEPLSESYRALGWSQAVGSSGTILAIAQILEQEGWSHGEISRKALRRLADHLIEVGRVDALQLTGLKDERRPVIAGGVAVLLGLFEELGIKRMRPSAGALREGLLYELLGRIEHEDVRSAAVRTLMARHHVDLVQAERVSSTALALFDQVAEHWELEDPEYRSWLEWAAQLHEIGLSVNYSGFHRHGEYLLHNADLHGFTQGEKDILAALVRSHRRKLNLEVFDALRAPAGDVAPQLVVLLRIAVRLHRARRAEVPEPPRIVVDGDEVELQFEPGFLESHPLTHADLESEARYLAKIGFELRYT